jgi:hypothetical protein
VAPSSGTRVNIGPYHATVGTGTGFTMLCIDIQDQPPCSLPSVGQTSALGAGLLGMWVQIPSIGGGYHDLVIGSWGLSQAQLTSIVQSALPDRVVATDAGLPPWSVVPACAPGQTPDPNASSAWACAATP